MFIQILDEADYHLLDTHYYDDKIARDWRIFGFTASPVKPIATCAEQAHLQALGFRVYDSLIQPFGVPMPIRPLALEAFLSRQRLGSHPRIVYVGTSNKMLKFIAEKAVEHNYRVVTNAMCEKTYRNL